MLKHIKPKDLVEFVLGGIIITALVVVTGILETAPLALALWVSVILSIVLWVTWFIVVCVQRTREHTPTKLKILRDGRWVDVNDVTFNQYNNFPRPEAKLFDQDDHLNNKEQA